MATVVARNRYKLLRLAMAQLPENSQREQPTLAGRRNRLSSARVSLGRMEHEETRLDPDKVRRVEFFHQPPGRQLVRITVEYITGELRVHIVDRAVLADLLKRLTPPP